MDDTERLFTCGSAHAADTVPHNPLQTMDPFFSKDPYVFFAFAFRHAREALSGIITVTPDGDHVWGCLLDPGDIPGYPFLFYGPCREEAFSCGGDEVPVTRLVKTGEACLAEVADQVGPIPAVLNEAIRMRPLASPSGLYLWDGGTVVFDHEGTERYRLQDDDPEAGSIERLPL